MAAGLIATVLSLFLFSGALYITTVLRIVPLRHIIFVVLTTIYALLGNAFLRRSARTTPRPVRPRQLTPMKHAVRLLFPFTTVFSLLVPSLLLIVAGKSPVDGKPTSLAYVVAPHLFLISSQICMETVGFMYSTVFTLYIRFAVTITMVTYRIPVLFTWYEETARWAENDEVGLFPAYTVALSQAAAVLNIVFWTFGLLCFLLLYCLPAVICAPPTSPVPPQSEPDKDYEKES